jgi:hypothetical protein
MPTFVVKGRKTNALTTVTVEAATRDDAIAQVVAQSAPGEEMDILDAQEASAVGVTGATGATGTAARK